MKQRHSLRGDVHPPETADDIVGWVDEILEAAIAARASDIHFEPMSREMRVKFRLDGVLVSCETLPVRLAENVVARLKVLAGLLTYRNDIPQEGRLSFSSQHDEHGQSVYDQRISIFPTIHGQRAVIRIFYEENQLTSLAQLGLPPDIADTLRRLSASNEGVLLLTGPAGSGKSTTLSALIRDNLQCFPGKSVITLEDPVERHVEGATQIQIPPHGELTFPKALRSLLRQDPEVLMLGEIRDAETAHLAVEAGLTGHLLMSTMHSGTPAATLLRLLEMGIPPYQVTSSVAGIVNQRLVRRLCDHCKDPETATATGCSHCFQTGYKGRLLLAELLVLSPAIRQAILERNDTQVIEGLLAKEGHQSLLSRGRHLVARGLTSQQEVQRVCGAWSDN
jgi:type II secretory ATPase GspE/PulE/Tfp pilus assembly ATPase PilB-like protein